LTDEDQTKKFSLNTFLCRSEPLHRFSRQQSKSMEKSEGKQSQDWGA